MEHVRSIIRLDDERVKVNSPKTDKEPKNGLKRT
jgi:hypothetical protein